MADDERDMRDYFHKILPRLGHTVAAAAENGDQLVDFCHFYRPDLVITDIKMPGMDGIEAALKIYEQVPIPVILVSAYSDARLIERAEVHPITAYLVKPIKQTDLEPAIQQAMHRFEQFEALRREASDVRRALEDRKIIERAGGVSPTSEDGYGEAYQAGRDDAVGAGNGESRAEIVSTSRLCHNLLSLCRLAHQ